MYDPGTMSVAELRAALVELGMSEDEADAIKGKSLLRETLNSLAKSSEEDEDDLDVEVIEYDDALKANTLEYPTQNETFREVDYSGDWHEYVMNQFEADELIIDKDSGNKMPKLSGLRRLTTKLVGEIHQNDVEVVAVPNTDNGFSAVVKSVITVMTDSGPKGYSDVADCSSFNTPAPFNLHLTSTAASKAEARVLRKVLGIRNTISAEEFSSVRTQSSTEPTNAKSLDDAENLLMPTSVTDSQIDAIEQLCKNKEVDIDVMKFINKGENKYTDIRQVPQDVAIQILKTLNCYRNKDDGYRFVPEEFKGFKADWRNSI